jgi:DNA-binding transcriptional MerR regulator
MKTEERMEDDTLTTLPAARILEVSTERVRQLEAAGLLRARRTTSGVRLFSRRDVEQLAQTRREARRRVVGA